MFRNQQGDSKEGLEPRLAALFAAYRDATPDPEPGPDFQPLLWRKIEAKRTFAFSLKRLAQGIVTAAAAVSLALGLILSQSTVSQYSSSYVELLSADQSRDMGGDELAVELVSMERAR